MIMSNLKNNRTLLSKNIAKGGHSILELVLLPMSSFCSTSLTSLISRPSSTILPGLSKLLVLIPIKSTIVTSKRIDGRLALRFGKGLRGPPYIDRVFAQQGIRLSHQYRFRNLQRQTMASTASNPQPVKAHMTFGILADVQYADCEDGTDYSKTRQRFYRNSLNLLKNAINDWKRLPDPVSFVLQLGDLIDGKNKRGGEANSKRALNTALHPFNSLHVPIYHVIGNHELYNMKRSFYLTSPLNSSLSLSIETNSNHLYYTFLPHPKLRVVALDTYEVGLLGYEDKPDDENYKTALTLLHQKNKNEDVNDVTGLEGLERRWAAYNGAVSEKQLQWLSQVLQKAKSKEENVIIMTHVALQCEYKDYTVCLAWNYQEVMNVIHQHQCVIGILAGHEHAGWDYVDEHGIQHITLQGIIETRPGGNAYATARLWDQCLTVTGVGRVPSFTIPLRFFL